VIYNVTFRVRDHSNLTELFSITERNIIFIYCNQIYDEYIFEGPISGTENTELLNYFGNTDVRINNPTGEIVFVHKRCSSQDQDHLQKARSTVGKNQGLIQSGYQMKDWQYYNTLIFGKEQVENLVTDLDQNFDHTILLLKELQGPDLNSNSVFVEIKEILNKLTDLQLEVLLKCIEQDYYSIPRKVHIKDIASDMGKSRSSIQTVFRMAENKVMDVIVPQLLGYLTEHN
jgi:hypothetical protein